MPVLNWITRLVKQAVLQGFREAIEEIDLHEAPEQAQALSTLQSRMASLPPPSKKSK